MTGALSKAIATLSCSEDPPPSPPSNEQSIYPDAADAQLQETSSASKELSPKSRSRIEYVSTLVDKWVQNSATEPDDAKLAKDCDAHARVAQERSLRHSFSQSCDIMDEEEVQEKEKEAASEFLVGITPEPLVYSDGNRNEEKESESRDEDKQVLNRYRWYPTSSPTGTSGSESESESESNTSSPKVPGAQYLSPNVTAWIRSVCGGVFFLCTGVVCSSFVQELFVRVKSLAVCSPPPCYGKACREARDLQPWSRQGQR